MGIILPFFVDKQELFHYNYRKYSSYYYNEEDIVLAIRRFILVFLSAALFSLTGCRSTPDPDAVQAPPALVSALAGTVVDAETTLPAETTAAAEATTVPTEPTQPVPSGLPEPEGTMYISIALTRKGAPRMDWDPVPGAVTYEVSRSLYPDYGFSPLSSTQELHYTNASAPKGMTHYYQVRAIDANEIQIDTSPVLSIETRLVSWENKLLRYVSVPKVKLHTHPDSESPEISLRYMDEVKLGQAVITRETGTWYRVYHQDTLYYMLMQPDTMDLTSDKSQFRYTPQTTLQKNVLDLALDICNNRNTTYVPGGAGEVNADGAYQFDCSGLVTYILNNAMQPSIPTYRLSASMSRLAQTDVVYNAGFPGEFRAIDVPLEEIRTGDVLFFRSQLDLVPSEEMGHCSIYLGNNEFIHCTSVWEDAVCIMPLIGDFRDNLLAIRRFIPESPTPAETVKVINGPYRRYKIYTEKNSSSEVVATPCQGDALTVLYTNNDDWAYVRTMSNSYGWFRLEHLGISPAQS